MKISPVGAELFSAES